MSNDNRGLDFGDAMLLAGTAAAANRTANEVAALAIWFKGWWGVAAAIIVSFVSLSAIKPEAIILTKEGKKLFESFAIGASEAENIIRNPPTLPRNAHAKSLANLYREHSLRYNRIYSKIYGEGPVLPDLPQG
jgi:hypothetical protein